MFFWLKKALGFWAMPLPFCLTLLIVGLWLMRKPRRARAGRVLAITGVALLVLLSNKFVSFWLVHPLEAGYAAIPELRAEAIPPSLAACKFVVVLGSGNGNTPGLSATNRLSPSALARITEAVRLLRALPDAKMIVSGPAEGTHPSHATVLARAAESLGIDPGRIVYIDHARDTEEESLATNRLVGDAPFALITSAWHMPRAVGCFRAAGWNVLPYPVDYRTLPRDQWPLLDTLGQLTLFSVAAKEWVGLIGYHLMGRTDAWVPEGSR